MACEAIDVSIVIPAFNEEQAIGRVIDDVRRVLEQAQQSGGGPCRHEIIVVDDASQDDTATVASQHGAEVLRHEENLGSGASRRTGIARARGEVIVMIDGDASYPAAAIPDLLAKFPGFDQVIGARRNEKGTLRPLRFLAKTFIRLLASYLVRKKIPDLNSGLRAFKKTVMQRYVYLLPDGFSCVSTMTLAFLANKHRVAFVPIEYFPRIGKSKFHPVRDTYLYLLTVIRLITYFNPLQVFLPLSFLLVLVGVVKSVMDYVWLGTLQESDIIAILAGAVVAAIGILADLIVVQGKRNHGS